MNLRYSLRVLLRLQILLFVSFTPLGSAKECFRWTGLLSKEDQYFGAGQWLLLTWVDGPDASGSGVTPDSMVLVELYEEDIFTDDVVQVLTPVTGVRNSGMLQFRLPFDLSVYARGRDRLSDEEYYVRVSLVDDTECSGSSGHFHLDGHLSSLSLAEAPTQDAYSTGSVFEVRVLADGAPSRDVQCDLMHEGRVFDSAEQRIATYRTGPATTLQAKRVRFTLPEELSHYGNYYVRCETVDDKQPTLEYESKMSYGTFKIEEGELAYQFTQPSAASRIEANTAFQVKWRYTRQRSSQMPDKADLPTTPGLLRLERPLSPLNASEPLRQWDVDLAAGSANVTLPQLLVNGPHYLFSLVERASARFVSPTFTVLPALGRSAASPTPQPATAEPEPPAPTIGVTLPDGGTTMRGATVDVITLAPTPTRPGLPPQSFSRNPAVSPSTAPPPTTPPPNACGMNDKGEFRVVDDCGVCGGDNRCVLEAMTEGVLFSIGSFNVKMGALLGLIAGVLSLCLVCFFVIYYVRRRRAQTARDKRDRIDTRGANILMVESRESVDSPDAMLGKTYSTDIDSVF